MKRDTMTTRESDQTNQNPAPESASSLGATLLRVAWMAILLGIAMEVLLLLVGGALGNLLGVGPVIADFARNITWSVFVCVGLAIGTAISKARAPAMGALGLFSAPIAFEASRIFHKGTLGALAVTGGGAGDEFSPLVIAIVKGLEYGALGLGIGWIGQRQWGGALAHAAYGLMIGLVFGGAQVFLASTAIPAPTSADLIVQSVNQVLFPVGCSLVLFAGAVLGKRALNSG